MAKCKYEFSFKIECDEPIHELKIKLVDKKGHTTTTVTPVTNTGTKEVNEPVDEDENVDVPPEMMMDF